MNITRTAKEIAKVIGPDRPQGDLCRKSASRMATAATEILSDLMLECKLPAEYFVTLALDFGQKLDDLNREIDQQVQIIERLRPGAIDHELHKRIVARIQVDGTETPYVTGVNQGLRIALEELKRYQEELKEAQGQ